VVPTASDEVRFSVSGGSIVALDNADLTDHEPYQTDHRPAFGGRGLAILRATVPGELRVRAESPGLEPATLMVHVVRGHGPATVPPAR